MAGELWRGTVQLVKEVTYGTYLASTKAMYYTDPKFTYVRPPRVHKFATGTRDNSRSFSQGPIEVAGTLTQPLSADEIIELLLMGICGGVTPTSSVWTFKPTLASGLDSAAMEWQDGANPWHVSGCYVDSIEIKGNANGPNDVTATIFGKSLVAGEITAALTQRTPTIIEGWETAVTADAIGATAGTTAIPGVLINWTIKVTNGLARKYFASNSNTLGAIAFGELGVSCQFTFEASVASALTEFTNFNGPTLRLIQLTFGNNSGSPLRYVKVNLPLAWTAVALDQVDNLTRTYQFSGEMIFDATNLYGVEFLVQNSRTTAWV